jgi:hypothetical protein
VDRVESSRGSDDSRLAVQLAAKNIDPGSSAMANFRAALGETASGQTRRLEAGEDWRGLYGGVRLRLGLLILTALLLFAEGVVSLRLSPSLGTSRD